MFLYLLGNGINRSFNTGSWNDLLSDMSCDSYDDEEYELIKELSYPLQALLITGDNVDEGIDLVADKLLDVDVVEQEQKEIINNLLSLLFDAVFTTNYTYEIEKIINPSFSCKKSRRCEYRFYSDVKRMSNLDRQFGIYRYMNVDSLKTFPNIWHIHGEAGLPNSMVLGHYYYGKLMYAIQNYIPTFIRRYKGMQKSGVFKPKSWIDYFMIGNVYILGLGLDPSEMDLWWLINCKKRFNNNHSGKGRVYWYEPNLNDVKSFAKKQLADANDIKVKTDVVGMDEYKEYYSGIYKIIERNMKNRGEVA